ncbi:MAG: NAD-dependent epimerase/dehydratase family protein, partial [Gemmatimonadaceae bacterium]
MLGATGTIGRATVRALHAHGHEVVCFVRPPAQPGVGHAKIKRPSDSAVMTKMAALPDVTFREGDVRNATSIARDGFGGERFDAVVSCMASRTGAPIDAW